MNLSQKILSLIYNNFIWRQPTLEKKIFLTFDDGPIPEVTEWVLDILKSYNIKATFFCIGDNIRKHPLVFKRILEEGHQVGNHTYNHLNGWKYNKQEYFDNFLKCQEEINKFTSPTRLLFRPPYGKLKLSQSRQIRQLGYDIIMWYNLTKDYDKKISASQCFNRSIKGIKNGSIIVFHDSLKAKKNLQITLPKTIEYLLSKGFQFDKL